MNSLLSWDHVPIFLAVLDTGSLSGAARSLGISQPTVGRQIAAMEAELGAGLFGRGSRGLVPTEMALALAEPARRMAEEAAAIERAALGAAAEIDGTVRITASEVVATHFLPPLIAEILSSHEGLEIELVASNRTDNLLLREADIAVRMVEPRQGDLIAKRIGSFTIGFYAHQNYLAHAGTPTSPADLTTHVFLGDDTSGLIVNGARELGLDVMRRDFRFRTDNQVTYFSALTSGVGIGVAMCSLMRHYPAMTRLLPEAPIPDLPVYLVAHRELQTAARVRCVFDALAKGMRAAVDG